jgi:hypothetical protein
MSDRPITSPQDLQEELSDVAERAVVGGYDRNDPDGVHMSVPSDDGWSVADVLSGMMAGQHAHGTCIEVYGYKLYNTTISGDLANVWRVHPPDDGRAVDAINLDNFATASEIETYLLEGELEGR